MKMTIAQALSEGYDMCLQDGYAVVEEIGGLDPEELVDNQYWVCEKEPMVFTVNTEELRGMLSDHIERSAEFDLEDIVAQQVLDIPLEKFTQAADVLNALLADKKWWTATDIELIP